MISITVDTALFAIPPYADSEKSVTTILNRILHWHDVISKSYPILAFKHSDAEEILSINGCWPIEKDLETLLSYYCLEDVFSINDIAKIYNSLLSRLHVLSDFGIEILSCSSIKMNPDILNNQGPSGLVEHSKMIYATHCLNRLYSSGKSYIACGTYYNGPFKMDISGAVKETIGLSADIMKLPCDIDSQAFVIDKVDSIASHCESLDIWNDSKSNSELYFALALGCVEISLVMGKCITFEELPKFSIGLDFFESVKRRQAGPQQYYSRVTFETCCRVIIDQPKYKLMPMGRPKQITREYDKASAWRTHITKGHEALRLMIWFSNNTIELSNVGYKNELYISTNGPEKSCIIDF